MNVRSMLSSQPARPILTTVGELVLLGLMFGFIITLSFWTMVAWQIATVLYLAVGFFVVRRSAMTRGSARISARRAIRSPALRVLSWALPLGASGAGAISVVMILFSRTTTTLAPDERPWVTAISAVSILLSWVLLHTGFARVYETAQDRTPGQEALVFARQHRPGLIDFVYFSFTIGTSFSASDTVVATPRMRFTVLIHSVTSFFYNAVVVAMAIQVLQSIGAAPR